MRISALRPRLTQRLHRPATWVAVLVFTGGWVLARLLAGVPLTRLGVMDGLIPLSLLAGHLVLSPLPWQWTGDDRPVAPLWRGSLQALPWNAAWVFLVLLGIQSFGSAPRWSPSPASEGRSFPPPPRPPEHPRPLGPFAPPAREPGPHPGPDWMLLFLNLPFAMVLGWFLAEKERSEEVETELRERERAARAQALQSQLNPHVLFNVLAGLTELVQEDPDAAERALVGLTELLRMLLQRGSSLRLPLGQERALLKRYLEIESIRLGGRLKVHWEWDETLDGLQLPPLLLQPLVENAIRHGIAPSHGGGRLRVEALREAWGLLLRVANTGQSLPLGHREGTGLGNLEERLRLAPELKGTFRLRTEGEWTVAELRLGGRLSE